MCFTVPIKHLDIRVTGKPGTRGYVGPPVVLLVIVSWVESVVLDRSRTIYDTARYHADQYRTRVLINAPCPFPAAPIFALDLLVAPRVQQAPIKIHVCDLKMLRNSLPLNPPPKKEKKNALPSPAIRLNT